MRGQAEGSDSGGEEPDNWGSWIDVHHVVVFVNSLARDDFWSDEDGVRTRDSVLVRDNGDRHVGSLI